MIHWVKRHDARKVPMRAIIDKLRMCQEHGVDIDRIPLDLSISDLLRFPVVKIKELADATGTVS